MKHLQRLTTIMGLAGLASLATVAFLLLPGCDGKAGPGDHRPSEGAVKKREAARVHVQPVLRREMLRVLETTTRVESEHQIEVFPRASGVVTEILAEEGDRVGKGQVLARLDSRDMKLAVQDAEVGLEEARANLPKLELASKEAESRVATAKRGSEQSDRDYARNAAIAETAPDRPALVSGKDLDQSRLARDNALSEYQNLQLASQRARLEELAGKNALERAQLTLDRARLSLSHMSLEAPFAGVIASRSIKVGDTLGAGTVAFVLTDPDSLRAVFYRPQRELAMFGGEKLAAENGSSPGSAEIEVHITAEAVPGRNFRGVIERIAPTIDPQSGNFRITARLGPGAISGGSGRLLPGMLVRISIVTERRPGVIVVNKRAIRREGDADLVFAVRGGRAARIPVAEGLSDDEYVEVSPLGAHKLEAGERVIVVGNRDLEDGAEVAVETSADSSLGEEARPRGGVAEAPDATGRTEPGTSATSDQEAARVQPEATPPTAPTTEEPKPASGG